LCADPCGDTNSSSIVDLTLVLDASGSIGYANWSQLINFTNNLISRLNIGPSATQVAVVVFGNDAAVQLHLNLYQSADPLSAAIRRIVYTGGSTNLNDALFLVWSDIYAPGNGLRSDANRIAVIVTDGEDNVNADLTMSNATRCKDRGIRLIAVAVGSDINKPRLMSIASNSYDYYPVTAYSELATIVGALAVFGKNCSVVTTVAPPTTTTTTQNPVPTSTGRLAITN